MSEIFRCESNCKTQEMDLVKFEHTKPKCICMEEITDDKIDFVVRVYWPLSPYLNTIQPWLMFFYILAVFVSKND